MDGLSGRLGAPQTRSCAVRSAGSVTSRVTGCGWQHCRDWFRGAGGARQDSPAAGMASAHAASGRSVGPIGAGSVFPNGMILSGAATGRPRASGCTPPTTFPNSPAGSPGPVRARLRAGHYPARGDDQKRRGRHRRPGMGPRLCHTAATRAQDGQDRRRHRLGPGRPGVCPAAHPGRAHGHDVRAGRPHRRAAAVRDSRLPVGETPSGPAAGADARGGYPVPRRGRGGHRPGRHRSAAMR